MSKVNKGIHLDVRLEPTTNAVLFQGWAVDGAGSPDYTTHIAIVIPIWDHDPLPKPLGDLTTTTIRDVRSETGDMIARYDPTSLTTRAYGAPPSSVADNPAYTYCVVRLSPVYNFAISSKTHTRTNTSVTEYSASLALSPSPIATGSQGYSVAVPKVYLFAYQGTIPNTYVSALAVSNSAQAESKARITITGEVDGSIGDHLIYSQPKAIDLSQVTDLGDVAQVAMTGLADPTDPSNMLYSPDRMDFSSVSLSREAAQNSLKGTVALAVGGSLAASLLFYGAATFTDRWRRIRRQSTR